MAPIDKEALEAMPEGSIAVVRFESGPTKDDVERFRALEASTQGRFTFLLLGPRVSSLERLTDVPERELCEHLLRARREPSVQDMAAKLLEQFVIARRPEFRRRK